MSRGAEQNKKTQKSLFPDDHPLIPVNSLARLPDLIEPLLTVQSCCNLAAAVDVGFAYLERADGTPSNPRPFNNAVNLMRSQLALSIDGMIGALKLVEKDLERMFHYGLADAPQDNKLDLQLHREMVRENLDRNHSFAECTSYVERLTNEWKYHLSSLPNLLTRVADFYGSELLDFRPIVNAPTPEWYNAIAESTEVRRKGIESAVFYVKTANSALERLEKALSDSKISPNSL